MDKDNYFSVSETAEIMGISRTAVLKKIYTRKLKAERIGHFWAIPRGGTLQAIIELKKIIKNKKKFIIEGIAGAGKTTLKNSLKQFLKNKKLYEFSEEELLLGWKHIHIPGISMLRLRYLNLVLDYIEKKIETEKDAIFVLERFHISTLIFEYELPKDFMSEYNRLINRLKKLPVYILISRLKQSEIKERSVHKERNEQWNEYLNEKLKLRGFSDLKSLYIAEQKKVFEIAKKQKIPYLKLKETYNGL